MQERAIEDASAPTGPSLDPSLDPYAELFAGVAARAAEADRRGRLPAEDVAALAASGFTAAAVPAALGGPEASLGACVRAVLELGKASGSTALVAAMPLHIIGHARETQGLPGAWPPETFAAICNEVLRGGLLNAAASEPALGSPSRGGASRSRAVWANGGDVLTLDGHKTWVTGGRHLTHLLVRLDLDETPALVWVPADRPGVRWEETWRDVLSLRASDSDDLFLEGVRVPRAHLLEHGGSGVPNVWFPLLMAATYLGVAFCARDAAIRYARERTPTALGRPIATLPKIQRQVGEIHTALAAARALLFEAADRWQGRPDEAQAFLPQAAAAKHQAVEAAIFAAERALRLAGAAGIGSALPLERCYRDVRGGLLHPPAGDEALERVGRALLAEPPPASEADPAEK